MADIVVRRGNGGQMAPSVAEPFRRMREFMQDPFRALMRWDPFQELMTLRPLEETEIMGFVPDFDVKETKDRYDLIADLPGLKEQDLDISLKGNRLSVSGKRESEKEERTDTYYSRERAFGRFVRSFTLPEDVDPDRIQAELKEGVLRIHVPKKAGQQAKKISVSTAGQTGTSGQKKS